MDVKMMGREYVEQRINIAAEAIVRAAAKDTSSRNNPAVTMMWDEDAIKVMYEDIQPFYEIEDKILDRVVAHPAVDEIRIIDDALFEIKLNESIPNAIDGDIHNESTVSKQQVPKSHAPPQPAALPFDTEYRFAYHTAKSPKSNGPLR